MEIRLNNRISILHERSFSETSLPLTMKLADILNKIISLQLNESSNSLPFHDRFLCWLIPTLERDIILYHGGAGPLLSESFTTQAVQHLDQQLYLKLAASVEKIRPGIMDNVDEIVTEPMSD